MLRLHFKKVIILLSWYKLLTDLKTTKASGNESLNPGSQWFTDDFSWYGEEKTEG